MCQRKERKEDMAGRYTISVLRKILEDDVDESLGQEGRGEGTIYWKEGEGEW